MIQITNACKQFGKTVVLNQINLTIAANSVVGLAGPSGSGKSTLLRCIQQLEKLDCGRIELAGKSGFMFQDFQLFPHMTVLDNLVYAPSLHEKGTDHEGRALELLAVLGLESKAHAFPQQLSGGQKQRVALARSLMMKPDLLLCDEPTSGLDRGSMNDVAALLNQVKGMNVTMVIASHDLPFLTGIAERVVVINQGNLIADLTTADLTDPIAALQTYY
ncbi:amino acid ABC transporter ATP-binding protein [Legionella taurinensis]|uniref:Amino acid ABC transporter ATP-binding protein n=1 Tax=Legionella taurinensis TaxID=70611 RepID=A0A3A5L2F1_9GAMM|nr:ATP-binding cassette domain-containing protein [Legionella taurinensis]MDX1838610.1 ATP-binding cassette domain-containing protein [Legionella taurinensis]PUT39048.1 amino acid ABC transporter ATP-binding protein [Legionella taurinensis]PUT41135.1 amino acid ABC transporter ATP-binding protein [Legionella taurinensis]PUT43510.1 amino acid ABC transporter ATP-binding protein [Legionella taurinensis]PUT46527.1 amino acid ABC transporter ATP-binding protein [Legionella taurinensis]